MQTRRATLAIFASALLVVVASCGGDDSSGPGDNGAFTGTIHILDNRFSPASVTISAGDSVTWRWEGNNFHTVTQGTNPTTPPPDQKLFDSGLKDSGTFGFRFNDPGTVQYYCDPHRTMGMTGTITVKP